MPLARNALLRSQLARRDIWRRAAVERLTEPLHLNLISAGVALFGGVRSKAAFDLVVRRQHAYGLLKAADEAKARGLREVTVVELGVASGTGLLNICEVGARMTEETGVGSASSASTRGRVCRRRPTTATTPSSTRRAGSRWTARRSSARCRPTPRSISARSGRRSGPSPRPSAPRPRSPSPPSTSTSTAPRRMPFSSSRAGRRLPALRHPLRRRPRPLDPHALRRRAARDPRVQRRARAAQARLGLEPRQHPGLQARRVAHPHVQAPRPRPPRAQRPEPLRGDRLLREPLSGG